MNYSILSLKQLCLREIVQNFGQFYFAFTASKDRNIHQKFKFLQRRFSVQLATALHMHFKLKDDFLGFVINEHLNFFVGEWIKNRPHLKCMEELFCRLPNLTRICFRHCDDKILKYIATFCPKIVEIDVRHSKVTDDGIRYLYEKKKDLLPCPDLKSIFISKTLVTDKGVECLIRNLPSLEKIEYQNVPLLLYSIYGKSVRDLGKVHHHDLVELKLSCFRNISYYSDVLKTCVTVCPKLETIACGIFHKEELNLLTDSHLKKLHILFMIKDSKINLDNFLKNVGSNLTTLKLSNWNFSDCSCTMYVSLLSTQCPNLMEFHAHNITFKDDHDDDNGDGAQIFFPFLTKCSLSHIDSSAARGVCLLLSSSPKLEAISIRFIVILPLEVKNEILKWCEKPSAKLIEFAFVNLEMSFIIDIILKSPFMKMMFLCQCDFNISNPYDVLTTFAKKGYITPKIFFRKFSCWSKMCEICYMRAIDGDSLFSFNFPSYDYYLKEEHRRPSMYNYLFHETVFNDIVPDEDVDWEENWNIL